MRLIKRYSNRKLYDTAESRYTTLEQLELTIKSGEGVKIIDAASEVDLTVQTLAQVFFEQQKRQPTVDVQDMLEIVRKGIRATPNRL